MELPPLCKLLTFLPCSLHTSTSRLLSRPLLGKELASDSPCSAARFAAVPAEGHRILSLKQNKPPKLHKIQILQLESVMQK